MVPELPEKAFGKVHVQNRKKVKKKKRSIFFSGKDATHSFLQQFWDPYRQPWQWNTYPVNNISILLNRTPLEKIKQENDTWVWINFFQMNTVGRQGEGGDPWQQLLLVLHLPKLENHVASAANRWIKAIKKYLQGSLISGKEDDNHISCSSVKHISLYAQGKEVGHWIKGAHYSGV